jgi:hypothetical protein
VLTEFALLPSVFDDTTQSNAADWQHHLRNLGVNLFPRERLSSVVVSNLEDGKWLQNAGKKIARIENQDARNLCQSLLQKINDVLVNRPANPTTSAEPQTNADWVTIAEHANVTEPIDRIVSACGAPPPVLALSSVSHPSFWNGIKEQRFVKKNFAEARTHLRKICFYAEFVSVINPHVRGDADGEIGFFKEIVYEVCRSRSANQECTIELHTVGNDNGIDGQVRSIQSQLANVVSNACGNVTLSFYLWRRSTLLDRYLIAGEQIATATGDKRKKPRWLVKMNHWPRPNDNPDQTTPWSVDVDVRGFPDDVIKFISPDDSNCLGGPFRI